MLDQWLFLAPMAAYVIGRYALRITRSVALEFGFVDKPDRRRKLHEIPVPLGGGAAVFLSAWTAWCIAAYGLGLHRLSEGDAAFLGGLALASTSTLVLGVVDDRWGLRGVPKLAGQLVAALVLVESGLRIDAIGAFGLEAPLGSSAGICTVVWIVLLTNAYNLIDGMDGFCGGVGLIVAAAVGVLSLASGRSGDALFALALLGALASFLRDNLPPARIYLGDAGSMTLGVMLAALSVRSMSGHGAAVCLPALVSLHLLPLCDVAAALARRWFTGRSLFTPDRGHLHHRLQARSGRSFAALAVGLSLASVGVCSATMDGLGRIGGWASLLSTSAVVGLLLSFNIFGRAEMRLAASRLRGMQALLPMPGAWRRDVVRYECHLLGARDWASVWDVLVGEAESAGACRIELAIDIPSAGETYHGLWALPTSPEQMSWSVAHALQVGGAPAGLLRVAGAVDSSRGPYLDKVGDLVRTLQGHLEGEGLGRPLALAPMSA